MKAALYARVSDDKKKLDGERRQDVERQTEMLKEYCKRTNITDYEVYIDDGKSAYTDDWNMRPDFKRLFNDCRRHFVTDIIVEDLTRFSRRVHIGLPLLMELGTLNINVLSLKEGEIEVTSSPGWLKSTMLLMFAEWDSRSKSDKVKSGMQKKKNLGKHIGRPKKRGGTNPLHNHIVKGGLAGASL